MQRLHLTIMTPGSSRCTSACARCGERNLLSPYPLLASEAAAMASSQSGNVAEQVWG
jgi:hypothetical protein